MTDFLAGIYPWTKALHIISVIAWMAGIFYLPRLFVYHVEKVEKGSETDRLFQEMERKLLRVIMNPGNDRGLGLWARTGLYARDCRLERDMALDEGVGGSGNDLVPSLAGIPAKRVHGRDQYADGANLSADERGADLADGAHRLLCHSEILSED